MPYAAYHHAVRTLLALANIQTPWEHHSPKGLRDALERTRQLLRRLGNPEKRMRFVHVTGTSGKGTVTNLVHAMLHADGRKVASYTSPHTTTLLERFHIGDALLAPHAFAAATRTTIAAYERHLRAGNQPLTFYELATCAALVAFAAAKVEWCVLEVGLGGRWDSTNIIPSPAVAVITNVDLDHTDILGNTRQKIAREKAGIIKKGAHVIVGEPRRALRAIFAKEAGRVDATIEYVRSEGSDHRLHNALVATRAALAVGVKMTAIERALARYKPLPCRLEVIQDTPRVIIDGAHNPAKIAATVARVPHIAKGKIHVIFGCKNGKDAKRMLALLAPIARSVRTTRYEYGPRQPHNPFALEKLVPKAQRGGVFLLPHDALTDALTACTARDTILITGSLYLAGELRTHWVTENDILRTRTSTPGKKKT